MEKTNVLVIGGSAAGIVSAVSGKSCYPNKDFLVVRKEKQVLVPCGIPYIFGSLESSNKNLISDSVLINAGVKLKIDEIISINQENKICKTGAGLEISFEKLILATGSIPKNPDWLKGVNLENVFTIPKNKEYLDNIFEKIKMHKKVIIIGGGFIGVEVSDEINKMDKHVAIIEKLPHILGLAFDEDISIKAEEVLKARGVDINTDCEVKEIVGDDKVTGVLLKNGNILECDVVILAMGYKPNTEIAKESNIDVNEKDFIKVDEYMRTKNPDIFAVGDCAEKRDFITRKINNVMLASTACAEARIAGMNLYKLSIVKTFNGTIAIFSTAIGDTGFGVAGIIERIAQQENFEVITSIIEGVNKHPAALPNAHKQIVKLIAAKESGILLGGEVFGGTCIGEMTNLIGFAIQNKMTVSSILTSQIGTHPLLTSAPTSYPFIKAAEMILKKLKHPH